MCGHRKRVIFPSTSRSTGCPATPCCWRTEASSSGYICKMHCWIYSCGKQMMDRVIAALRPGARAPVHAVPSLQLGLGRARHDGEDARYRKARSITQDHLRRLYREVTLVGGEERAGASLDRELGRMRSPTLCEARGRADGQIFNIGSGQQLHLGVAELILDVMRQDRASIAPAEKVASRLRSAEVPNSERLLHERRQELVLHRKDEGLDGLEGAKVGLRGAVRLTLDAFEVPAE